MPLVLCLYGKKDHLGIRVDQTATEGREGRVGGVGGHDETIWLWRGGES